MKDNQTIGQAIMRMRQDKGFTQTQLAAMLGVSRQAVSKWESGQALPDIGTMLELTHLFGITVEELIGDEIGSKAPETTETTETTEIANTEMIPEQEEENKDMHMNYNELMQMAPYMSKEAVGEIALKLEGRLAAWQIAKLAPFVKQETLEQLIEKHHPDMTWDTLHRLAPFMSRETVDRLAREISEGKRSIHPTQDDFTDTIDEVGKAINEFGKGVGKAFDDIGKGVGDTVQRVLKFGQDVFSDVSEAIGDLANDINAEETEKPRSERAIQLRKRAFERALTDGRFDWIAGHISEIEEDDELMGRIAEEARKRGMHDWINANMPGYMDDMAVDAAIENGNWSYLGDHAWQLEPEKQAEIAKAAAAAENWEWLEIYSDQLDLTDCAPELARTAAKAGAKLLAKQLCESHMDADQIGVLAKEALEAEDAELLQLIIAGTAEETKRELFEAMAKKGSWETVEACIASADNDMKESMMETAVDVGNFDAVDMLDKYL